MSNTGIDEEKQDKAKAISNKIHDLKSNLILDASLTVFSQKGFASATLEDIAQEMGFSKASLYNYYPDKEGIFLALAIRETERFINDVMDSGDSSVSSELSFKENMHRYLKLKLEYSSKYFHFIVSMNVFELFKCGDECKNPNKLHEYVDFKEDVMKKSLLPIFDWAIEKKEVALMFDKMDFCRLIDGMCLGIIHSWILNNRIDDISKTADQLVEFLINGIGVK